MGAYRYCTGATGRVPGVHREGPPLSEGLMGRSGQGTSPWRAGHIPPWAHAPRVGGGGILRGRPLAWGASPLPLAAAPSRSHLEGAGPLPPSPIYRGARGGMHTPSKAQPLPYPTPLLLRKSLAKPCRSTAAPPPPRRRAAVGALFLNLSLLLARSRRGRRPRSVRVLNAEVPSSVLGSSVIWITTSTTPSTRSLERFRSRSTRVCRCTPLSLIAR